MASKTFFRTSRGEVLRSILFAALALFQISFGLPVWLVVLTVAAAATSIAGIYVNRTRPMVVLEDEQIRFKPGLLRPEDRIGRAAVLDWRRTGGDGMLDPGRFILEIDGEGNLIIPERAIRASGDELEDALEAWLAERDRERPESSDAED